jgi:hypothetical protein
MECAIIVIQAALPVMVYILARHVLIVGSTEDTVFANTHAAQLVMLFRVTLSPNAFRVTKEY